MNDYIEARVQKKKSKLKSVNSIAYASINIERKGNFKGEKDKGIEKQSMFEFIEEW